jgi:surface antigen
MWIDTSGWHGSAWTYYDNAPGWGLNVYPNKGIIPPIPGDIFVYGKGSSAYGHVAIVTAVRSDSIDIIEQNVNPSIAPNAAFRTVTRSGNGFPDWSGMPVRGWAHKGPIVGITSPGSGNNWAKNTWHIVQWNYRTDLGANTANIDLTLQAV